MPSVPSIIYILLDQLNISGHIIIRYLLNCPYLHIHWTDEVNQIHLTVHIITICTIGNKSKFPKFGLIPFQWNTPVHPVGGQKLNCKTFAVPMFTLNVNNRFDFTRYVFWEQTRCIFNLSTNSFRHWSCSIHWILCK